MARNQLECFPFHTSQMDLTKSKVFIEGVEYELAAALVSASGGQLPVAIFTRKGNWDASAGSFPGSGSAGLGWVYRCSVAGTVNGVSFTVGDTITSLVDGASSSTYAGNWSKSEGALTAADITDALGSTPIAALSSYYTISEIDALMAKPTAIEGNQVSIGTSPTLICNARTGRASLTLVNMGSTDVFVGGASVAASSGQLLIGVKGGGLVIDGAAAVYGIVAAGTQSISYMEAY